MNESCWWVVASDNRVLFHWGFDREEIIQEFIRMFPADGIKWRAVRLTSEQAEELGLPAKGYYSTSTQTIHFDVDAFRFP